MVIELKKEVIFKQLSFRLILITKFPSGLNITNWLIEGGECVPANRIIYVFIVYFVL